MNRSRFQCGLVGLFTTVLLICTSPCVHAQDERLQLHYNAGLAWRAAFGNVQNVEFRFTQDNLPYGPTHSINLEFCVWDNDTVYPPEATDTTLKYWFVTDRRCNVNQAGFEDLGSTKSFQTWSQFYTSVGRVEVDAPTLMTLNATTELYCGIDLTAYVEGGKTAYAGGDQFQIVNGTSPLLPGYVFGTTDTYFDPAVGWKTDNPFTGTVEVFAETGLCPEPALAPIALCGLLMLQRRRAAHRAA